MVVTPSTMPPIGMAAPDFTLPDVDGRAVSLEDFDGAKALVVVFMCNHCPFVKHLKGAFRDFAAEYQEKGMAVVAINSNDAERFPQDGPEAMARDAAAHGYSFPYLWDESQEVAKAYRAACTPDFFLFDEGRSLAYRGQFDGSRPGSDVAVTGEDLRAAADAVLARRAPSPDQRASVGCNIKWKPGNAPSVPPPTPNDPVQPAR